MTDDLEQPLDEREQALRMIKRRRDLATHAVAYLVFNGAVWVVWALSGGGTPWPLWLTGLWGIGLAMNVWDVYGRRPVTEEDVQREMRRRDARRRA